MMKPGAPPSPPRNPWRRLLDRIRKSPILKTSNSGADAAAPPPPTRRHREKLFPLF
jgi:hypothetical protein